MNSRVLFVLVWLTVSFRLDGRLVGSDPREVCTACAKSRRVVAGWRILVDEVVCPN